MVRFAVTRKERGMILNSMQGVVELKTLRAHPIPHGAELTALIQTTDTSEYRAAHKHGGIELAL
jgi:hypothetical protein